MGIDRFFFGKPVELSRVRDFRSDAGRMSSGIERSERLLVRLAQLPRGHEYL
jgi:hypothetical protein